MQALAHDGVHVVVQQACAEQLADQKAHTACGLEVVHIGAAVGVHAREQRHAGRELGKVVPVHDQTCRARHRHEVQGVVGRAARREQAHDAIDDDFGVDLVAHARLFVLRQRYGALDGLDGEGLAQWRAGVHKRGAGQVKAHDLHEHLVGVGRAVKRAGACAVICRLLGLEQHLAAHQALCVLLTHPGFVVVGQA